MAKIASVKLSWKPSVSVDAVKQVASVTIDGGEPTTFEVSPPLGEVLIDVKASSSVVFSVETTDSEGMTSISEMYSFVLGDLEAPQPATDLFHEVISVRDE